MLKKSASLLLLLSSFSFLSGFTLAKTQGFAIGNVGVVSVKQDPDCNFCKALDNFLNQNPSESAKRAELAAELLGALSELGKARDDFLRTGDFTNLFASAYYHVTELEMENILSNKYSNPTAKMEMMLSFYDSYRYNRAVLDTGLSSSIEPQWAKYYENARKFNATMADSHVVGLSDGNQLYQLITSGIDAHVQYDLPRAIRSTFENKIPASSNPVQISNEFKDTNNLFGAALQQTNKDISQAFSVSQWLIPREWVLDASAKVYGATPDVIAKRQGAYALATSGRSLPTANRPQRATNHQSLLQNGSQALQKMKDSCAPCSCDRQRGNTFYVNSLVNTGIRVDSGDKISIEASGSVSFGPNVGSAGPAGKEYFLMFGVPVAIDPGLNIIRRWPHGSLIGRIKSSTNEGWFLIGEGGEIIATSVGVLELNVNDRLPGDNVDQFEVRIRVCKAK